MWLTQSIRRDCISHSSREQSALFLEGENVVRLDGEKEKRRVAQADVRGASRKRRPKKKKDGEQPSVILAA